MNEDESVQRRISGFWDQVGPGYDGPDNVAAPGSAEYVDWLSAIRSVLPAAPSDLLDVGTGTGFVARITSELGHRVTGIDLSVGMLEAARLPPARAGRPLALVVGDAVDPPFPMSTFDVVISRSVLWTLREPAVAFTNWHALLRPGGRVVAIYGLADRPPTHSPDPEPGADPRGLFPRTYTPAVRAALPAMSLTDHEPLVRMAEDAGFVEVTVSPLTMVRGWETSPGSGLPYALVGHREAG